MAALAFVVIVWTCPPAMHYVRSVDDICMGLLGRLVLLGDVPGRDTVAVYGPLMSYLYAGFLSVSDSLFAFVLAGATGFAISLGVLFFLARRAGAGLVASTVLVTAAFACIPYFRLFRGPQWLLPLLLIAIFATWPDNSKRRFEPRVIALVGIICTGALYRLDVGGGLAIAATVGVFLRNREDLFHLALCAVIAASSWFIYLWLIGSDVPQYLELSVLGILGQPANDTLFLLQNGVAPIITFTVMVFCYVSFVFGGMRLRARTGTQRSIAIALIIAGALGLLSAPSALYFPNTMHVVFSAAPLFGGLALLNGIRTRSAIVMAAPATIAAGLLIWIAYPLSIGFASFDKDPRPRWQTLASDLDAVRFPDLAKHVDAIRAVVPADERVALLSSGVDCAIQFFARRRSGTIDYTLSRYLQPLARQRELNLISLEHKRTRALVVPANPHERIEPFTADTRVRQFGRVAFEDDAIRVLVRDGQ